jgi:ectoine hydroxylase-related dioxygenase (phytanoyl-CoA dioxygenase family)
MQQPLKVQAGSPVFEAGSSAISVTRLGNPSPLEEMRSIVGFYFGRTADYYVQMDASKYTALVAEAQDEMNKRALARRLAHDRREILASILGSDRIMIQSHLYLRATRPMQGGQESVGWHRESFYGSSVETAVNFWVPILNVTIENTLLYVPDSDLIPDEAIVTKNEEDPSVQRGSAAHRIGLLYSPKRIVSGVDFSIQRPFVVLPGEAAIFSGQLIHGAAVNRSDKIRFSIDSRLIAAENLRANKWHLASGKEYFETL